MNKKQKHHKSAIQLCLESGLSIDGHSRWRCEACRRVRGEEMVKVVFEEDYARLKEELEKAKAEIKRLDLLIGQLDDLA